MSHDRVTLNLKILKYVYSITEVFSVPQTFPFFLLKEFKKSFDFDAVHLERLKCSVRLGFITQ